MTHHRPGYGPALRVLTGGIASQEQRAAAHALMHDIAPDDLLWAEPGTPERKAARFPPLAPPDLVVSPWVGYAVVFGAGFWVGLAIIGIGIWAGVW